MRYEDPAFHSKYCSKEYKDNWERTFGEEEPIMKETDAPKFVMEETDAPDLELPMDVTMEVWVVFEYLGIEDHKGEMIGAFVSKEAAESAAAKHEYWVVLPTTLVFSK